MGMHTHFRALSLAALAAAAATPWPATAPVPPVRNAGGDTAATPKRQRRGPAANRNQHRFRSPRPVRRGRGRGRDSAGRVERRARVDRRYRPAGDGRHAPRFTARPGARCESSCRARSTSIRSVAAEIRFDEVVSDLPAIPRLDSAGNLSFQFGGRVTNHRRCRRRSIAANFRSRLNISEPCRAGFPIRLSAPVNRFVSEQHLIRR